MTREEIRKLMHDYFDDLLSSEERSSVETYLEEFDDVAREYELLGKLLEKAESLPIGIKTPDTIINKISEELLSPKDAETKAEKLQKLEELDETGETKKKRKETSAKDKKTKASSSKGSVWKKVFYIFIAVIFIAGAVFVYFYLDDNFPWQLRVENGEYQIDGEFSNQSELGYNNTLVTFDSTKISLIVPNAGKVEVGKYTMLQPTESKELSNIISLKSGSINVISEVDDPILKIKTPPAAVTSIEGNYRVTVDPELNVLVITSDGKANLQSAREQLNLVPNHSCKINSSGNIGIPYNNQADQKMVELLNKVSFDLERPIDYTPILQSANHKDGISLLYLLMDASSKEDRITIFLKLNELFPVPPGITEDGILNLDQKMIEKWKEDILWQI